MNITITDIKSPGNLTEDLSGFVPVEGRWIIGGDSESRSRDGVEQSVRNYMDVEYPIRVSVFHADGREIIGDLPSEGTFLAVRQ